MSKIRAYRIGVRMAGCFCLLLFGACSDDHDETETYPPLITEFADIYTDRNGDGRLLVTDKGNTYALHQPMKDLHPDAIYRIIGSYVLTDETNGQHPVVQLYKTESVMLLEQTEEPFGNDAPVKVTSIWRGGPSYINFNFSPKTQGGQHEWGYRLNGIRTTRTGQTYELSLYHRQSGDPYSYSTTVYASLYLKDIGELQQGDSITFTILTFDGDKTWRFAY